MRLSLPGRLVLFLAVVIGLYVLWTYLPAQRLRFHAPRVHIRVSNASPADGAGY